MEYIMGLQEKYFNAMKYGSKKIEIRLNDEKRKKLKIGDTIYFLLEPDRKKKIEARIVNLIKYKNFSDAIDNIPFEYLTVPNDIKEDYLNDLNKYYSKDDQNKYGVLAIEIEIQEKSCGMIVFKKEKEKLEVLLVHHNIGHWGLPKGHVEENETEIETAIREIEEETGIKAKVIGDFREVITYKPKENSIKDVVYFIGKSENNKVIPQLEEVSEADFIEINKALELIDHDNEKNLIESAVKYYQDNLIDNNFYNDDNLTKDDIDETVIRTKALIINSKGEILLGYSNKTYQFPGGHLENNETLSECLIREIKEETGIDLDKKIYIPFFLTRYYTKNYHDSLKNRENIIYYFIIYTDVSYILENTAYDEGEMKGNYTLKYILLENVKELLVSSIKDNPVNEIITPEMLEVFKYLEI